MTLKRATILDIPTLIEIEKSVEKTKVYSPMIGENAWKEFMDEEEVYLIEKEGVIVGNTSYKIKDKNHLYISGLIIKKEFQGQGIGRETMSMLLEKFSDLERVSLVTHPDNVSALNLYESLGFKVEGRKENYFGDGEPRLVLSK